MGTMNEEFSVARLFDAAFLNSFHQMVTGIIPLPGSAGVSELFYNYVFFNFFGGDSSLISASMILWRTATFHIVLAISGLVSAFYKSRPKESFHYANRETFVTLQLETYDERKKTADTMYETASLSRKAIQQKLRETTGNLFGGKKKPKVPDDLSDVDTSYLDAEHLKQEEPKGKKRVKKAPQKAAKKVKPSKVDKALKAKKKKERDSWESLDI